MKNLEDFDIDAVGVDNGNYFGMPFDKHDAQLVLVSVPWDVTVSYSEGTSQAPQAIIKASTQLDFYDELCSDSWKKGIATEPVDEQIAQKNSHLRKLACSVIDELSAGHTADKTLVDEINQGSEWLNAQVYNKTKELLSQNKLVGLVGGDHSTPYGHIKAVSEKYEQLAIVHFDAHMDLRNAYEGFTYSHASIMYNVAETCPNISHFLQIATRDYSLGELTYAKSDSRFDLWTDAKISNQLFDGESFSKIVGKMLEPLPQNVYVSFDIDSLEPSLCPNTGTPVAGGLSFNQAIKILQEIIISGRKIVGFDVCEVIPEKEGEFNANVGARILYKLCCLSLKNN